MNIRLGKFTFHSKLWIFVSIAILTGLLIGLGIWQLKRAHQKLILEQTLQTRLHSAPKTLTELGTITPDMNFQPVKLQGQFDNQHQLLLDNQFFKHQIGYHVLTPLITEHGSIVLINRGWIAAGATRQQLPTLTTIDGQQNLVGIIKFIPRHAFKLKTQILSTQQWPQRIEYLDLRQLQALFDKPLLPFMLLLQADQPHGFERNWQFITMHHQRHQGYAVQWFALAITLVIGFLATHIHRGKN
ncbi:MAG: SURF1 family protein [Gammaproteobacteria bacterium]